MSSLTAGWTRRFLFAVLLLALLVVPAASGQDEPSAEAAQSEASASDEMEGAMERFNTWFKDKINRPIEAVLFYKVFKTDRTWINGDQVGLPLIVVVLAVGGLFFTFRYGFINLRLFRHSIQVIRGKFDKAEDTGEVTHFQALTSALSATVGLGNIAGVAIAVSVAVRGRCSGCGSRPSSA